MEMNFCMAWPSYFYDRLEEQVLRQCVTFQPNWECERRNCWKIYAGSHINQIKSCRKKKPDDRYYITLSARFMFAPAHFPLMLRDGLVTQWLACSVNISGILLPLVRSSVGKTVFRLFLFSSVWCLISMLMSWVDVHGWLNVKDTTGRTITLAKQKVDFLNQSNFWQFSLLLSFRP